MAKKKTLKTLRTGFWERGFSIAKMSLKAGTTAAAYSIGNVFGAAEKQQERKTAMLVEQMGLIAEEFGELKGSLMKVGQMLSVYGEHFLPPEANQLLKALHFESPPVEWNELVKHLRRQLSKETLELLVIDETPLAAASLGQVHRARIKKTGQEIVLKIQYPGLEKAIDGDIAALKRLLSLAKLIPQLPDTEELFKEVRAMLLQELDYEIERKTLLTYREIFKGDERYIFPTPLLEFSSRRVLAMSFEEGERVDGPKVLSLSQKRRDAIGDAILDFYFKELLELKMVQTDPHFGNYRIKLGKNFDQIILYDFGAVRRFSGIFLENYKELISGIFFQDQERFEKAAQQLGMLVPQEDSPELRAAFWELCSLIMEPFLSGEERYPWGQDELAQRVAKKGAALAFSYKLRTPPRELVFLDRKMAGMFTFLSVLKVNNNARKILAKYLSQKINVA